MYTLTLTRDERKAIDWVGSRYDHGDKLYSVLSAAQWAPDDADWDSMGDITFTMPENVAWRVADIINADDGSLACFADELKAKLWDFAAKIV